MTTAWKITINTASSILSIVGVVLFLCGTQLAAYDGTPGSTIVQPGTRSPTSGLTECQKNYLAAKARIVEQLRSTGVSADDARKSADILVALSC